MIPSTLSRLESMISAVEDILIPALNPADSLAREQAGLLVSHLRLTIDQQGREREMDAVSLIDADRTRNLLVEMLIADLPDEAAHLAALDRDMQNRPARARDAIERGFEELIWKLRASGTVALLNAAAATILGYSERQTTREQIWFSAAGFDGDAGKLPSISEFLK